MPASPKLQPYGTNFYSRNRQNKDHNLPIKQYVRTGTKGPMKENLSIRHPVVKYWIHPVDLDDLG